ncbi:cytochrome c biogenesis protein CcsA [Dissulfurirhabdus thermomarina]|nr:cytochrome c biogenesis protein CcsA [Dissulfurirhabdus thermomarina]NMX23703.1 cytochrome c biogenesis protein CcsA [Dissulfurirhabdus thermomarina]
MAAWPEADWEMLLSWAAVAGYAVSAVALALGSGLGREGLRRAAIWLLAAGFGCHGLALGLRWAVVGHGPYTTTYEVYSSNAWVIAALFLAAAWRAPRLLAAGIVAVPGAMFFLMLGLAKYEGLPGLPTAFHYGWLAVHVLFVKLAIAAILVALGCSLWLLRRPGRGAAAGELDRYNYRFMGLAFFFWTVATASGAVWADLRWGRYWGWDPIETWSFIVWIGLGLNLHLQRFYGWRGRRAAWLTAACFGFFLLALFVIPLVGGSLHTMYVVGEGAS